MKKLYFVAAVGSAVFLFSGCKQAQQAVQDKVASTVQNAARQKVTEAMFAAVKDPDVRKYMVAQANQTAFRTKNSTGGEKKFTITETTLQGDSFNYKTTENDGTKDTSSLISMGDTTYVKDFSDGKWWKQTAKPVPSSSEAPGTQVNNNEKPVNFEEKFTKMAQPEFKAMGKEPCPSAPEMTCFKYADVDSSGKSSGHLFWFDDKQYLLRHDEYDFGGNKVSSDYSYDNISIQAPSPTKDVPADRNIYEYLMPVAPAAKGGANGISPQDMKALQQMQKQYQQQPAAPSEPAQDQAPPADQGGGE